MPSSSRVSRSPPAATAATRAEPGWWAPFGLFAAADAINAGVPNASEATALVAAQMGNAATISPELDAQLRAQFPVKLAREGMLPKR
jgi:hypothetical protein